MIVETAVGPCSFSLDPQRHGLVENRPDLSIQKKLTYQLPEKETALILVQSFFTNVSSNTIGIFALQNAADTSLDLRCARDV